MLKLIAVMAWISVFAIGLISLILCLFEDWSGVIVSLAIAPAIGIATKASEEAGF